MKKKEEKRGRKENSLIVKRLENMYPLNKIENEN